jgi:hypothetical protein
MLYKPLVIGTEARLKRIKKMLLEQVKIRSLEELIDSSSSDRHILDRRVTDAYSDEIYCPDIDSLSREKE